MMLPNRLGRRLRLWAGCCAAMLLLLAGTACFIEPITDAGIARVGVADGRVIAQAVEYGVGSWESHYETGDGGLTWRPVKISYELEDELWDDFRSTQIVGTPRGVYRIRGTDIIREAPGQPPETVYSAAYLLEATNVWVQSWESVGLGRRSLTTKPKAITYDPASGNVIAAMGIMGVLVEDAAGQWTRAGVGPYASGGFSAPRKLVLLLSWPAFWSVGLILPLAALAWAFTLAERRGRNAAAGQGCGPGCKAVIVFLSTLPAALALAITGSPRELNTIAVLFLALFATPVISVVVLDGVFDLADRQGRRLTWLLMGGSFLAMLTLIYLAFAAWLVWGRYLWPYKAGAALLCAAAAILLGRYLARRMPPPPPAEVAEV